jgi:hypothetical protein
VACTRWIHKGDEVSMRVKVLSRLLVMYAVAAGSPHRQTPEGTCIMHLPVAAHVTHRSPANWWSTLETQNLSNKTPRRSHSSWSLLNDMVQDQAPARIHQVLLPSGRYLYLRNASHIASCRRSAGTPSAAHTACCSRTTSCRSFAACTGCPHQTDILDQVDSSRPL